MTLPALTRRFARQILYFRPLRRPLEWARNAMGSKSDFRDPQYWDKALAGDRATYLGGTLSIQVRDAITLALLRQVRPEARRVLDVGCAAGSLGQSAPWLTRYVGVDISPYAISRARQHPHPMSSEFTATDLCQFRTEEKFDSVIFNEVLYYLRPDEAIKEVRRYSTFLKPDGVILASLKHDPKSRAILDGMLEKASLLNGAMFQQQTPAHCDWRIRIDSAMPAFLIVAIKPSEVSSELANTTQK